MPLTRTFLRDLPKPSGRAHPDQHWHQLTPLAWQALADPETATLWPDDASGVDSCCGFATALEILTFATGWPRLDVGALAWRTAGYGQLSPALGLVANILGDRIDELTAWLCNSPYAHHIETNIADAVGAKPPASQRTEHRWTTELAKHLEASGEHNPLTGGGDSMHLSAHADGPVSLPGPKVRLFTDPGPSPPQAFVCLDSYQGWYRALTQLGKALPDAPGGRSWRISVVCQPVGHLGTYRRSRTTGRWFRDGHAVHQMGIAND